MFSVVGRTGVSRLPYPKMPSLSKFSLFECKVRYNFLHLQILSVFLRRMSDKFITFALVNRAANDSIKENKAGYLGVPG